ncbi:uncharacterized protein BJX67DRAFT_164961 [Aspergillus lucknowensis]|uniref:Uncharacterized protein n=1 Tax=Aspergillus lucknowensis TaxID=176173 RepID=A0ABR4M4R0_9EURO
MVAQEDGGQEKSRKTYEKQKTKIKIGNLMLESGLTEDVVKRYHRWHLDTYQCGSGILSCGSVGKNCAGTIYDCGFKERAAYTNSSNLFNKHEYSRSECGNVTKCVTQTGTFPPRASPSHHICSSSYTRRLWTVCRPLT